MENPEVSILITNRNYGRFIGQCIESALNQTYKNFEIIVSDDNSTDNSVEIIKKYPVKLILIKGKPYTDDDGIVKGGTGFSHCANRLLKEAKGKYIAFQSADDFWEPNFLEVMVKTIKERKVKVVYCDMNLVDAFGKKFAKGIFVDAKTKEELHEIALKPVCVASNLLIDKEVFNDIGGYNEKIFHGQETEWGIRATKYYYFYHISKCLENRRKHSKSNSSVYVGKPAIHGLVIQKIKKSALEWLKRRENES